jgi:integrase
LHGGDEQPTGCPQSGRLAVGIAMPLLQGGVTAVAAAEFSPLPDGGFFCYNTYGNDHIRKSLCRGNQPVNDPIIPAEPHDRDWQRHSILTAIDTAATLAASSKAKYTAVVNRYLDAGHSLTDPAALASFAAGLPASGRAFLKAAVKLWTARQMTAVKGLATPQNVNQVQAAVYRFEALQAAIAAPAGTGETVHIWLSLAETRRLLALPGSDRAGRRDRLALGLLAGAGLRRQEAVTVTLADVKLQPVGERLRTALQIRGKGAKNRVVPISDRLAAAIEAWSRLVGGDGPILRALGRNGEAGASLSGVGLFYIVRNYGRQLARVEKQDGRRQQLRQLAPHDLRRTYAQIGYDSGVAITQISKLLGHSSVTTTQRYLNLELDLETTISDFVPFE